MAPSRRTWFLIRVAIYIAVLGGLIAWRGGVDWRAFTRAWRGSAGDAPVVTVAGRDLAPHLIDRLADFYRRDYPDVQLELTGGGTNLALEELLNGRADVAFLYRAPSSAEQALFRAAADDTALVFRVAVAAALLLAGAETPTADLTAEDVHDILTGARKAPFSRLYVPEPNTGLWAAVCERLALPDDTVVDSLVIYLADGPAVAAAVGNDPSAWGLVSSFDLVTDARGLPETGPRVVPVRRTAGEPLARPTRAAVADGTYPLYHDLLVACAAQGNFEAAKFVTHLASGRGQRQVERAGALPARQVAREIYLTRQPVGE